MTTPRAPVTSRIGTLIPFIILSNSKDEDTTLCVGSAPLSPDYVLASPDYSSDFDSNSKLAEDDSLDEDMIATAKSLPGQTALSPIVRPLPTRPLPTIYANILRLGQEIPLPPSASSLSSPPPSLLPSSSLEMTSSEQETMTLHARVETLEQHDMVTQDSLRFVRDRITLLQL
nr:hypothetical protein [Tanacetum cinerariifolium]